MLYMHFQPIQSAYSLITLNIYLWILYVKKKLLYICFIIAFTQDYFAKI